MMNAARIINKEIRKQRREGREEGVIFVAKKLKGKMHIKDIIKWKGDWKAVRRVTITNFVKIIAIKEIYSIICVM